MPIGFDSEKKQVRADVNHCWCLSCEHSASVLVEAASPHTAESAHRVTHSLRTLERFIFENYAERVHNVDGEGNSSSQPLRVPVLYLGRLFLEPGVYKDDEVSWGVLEMGMTAEHGMSTPGWLYKLRESINNELRPDGLLEAVFAPFDETLVYVGRNPHVARRILMGENGEAARRMQKRFAIDIPAQCFESESAQDTHRLYTTALLRVAVAYLLLEKCNGHAWSFDEYDCAVPYRTNEALQKTCLMLQLFADTHLDLFAALNALGSQRFDDTFLSSAQVHSAKDSHANFFSHSGAVPLSARLSLFERFYPHPLRAPWAGEIAALDGTPLTSGNVWTVQTSQGGGSGGGNINTSGSAGNNSGGGGGNRKSKARKGSGRAAAASALSGRNNSGGGDGGSSSSDRHSEDDFLDAMVHLFLSKTLNYPSLRRNYANIAVRNMHNFPSLFEIQLASFLVSALGNYPGPRFRPLWRARVAVTRSHHFSTLRFEPSWCASCGTDKMKSASKMNISKNACPRCVPAEKSLWCTDRCMRPLFMDAAIAERGVDQDGGAGQERLFAAQKISSASFFKYSATMRAIQRKIDEEGKTRRLTIDQQFEKCRMDEEVAGRCDLCEASQKRLVERGLQPMSAEELRIEHHARKHLCGYCRKREHDDAQRVYEKRFKGFSAKIGSKTLCSKHLCEACSLIGNNEMYSFYVAKECYAFRVDSEGCMIHTLKELNNWSSYRRLLFSGMDEVRRLINDEYSSPPKADTFANVAPGAISTSLSRKIRDSINYNHRYVKKTAVKFKKESFVDVLRKKLKTVFSDACVKNNMTRPQRPEDFLDNPQLVLDIGKLAESELLRKKSNNRSVQIAIQEIQQNTQRAYESLRVWNEDYGFRSINVINVAERAAAQAIECQKPLIENSGRSALSPTASVNFRILRYVGMSKESLQMIEDMAFNYEVLCLPDNPLASQAANLEKLSRADFCVLLLFCNTFAARSSFRIFPLSTQAARAQMHALRLKANILPHEDSPADLSVHCVCIDCSHWYTEIIPPTNFSELRDIVLDHDGDPMHSHLKGTKGWGITEDDNDHGEGASDTSAKTKKRHGKRRRKNQNALLDLGLMQLVCPQNANSTALKRMRKAGELEKDLVFDTQRAQIKKANSIRNARERSDQCGARPLMRIAMLGVAVSVTNEGQYGNVYALCGECGNIFCMAEGKPMNDGGVPNCGRHCSIGGPKTRPYTALHAYVPPYLHPERRGANNALRVARVAATDMVPYTAPPLTRSDLASSIRLLNDYEYAPPRKEFVEALGVPSVAHMASRGWVRCTPTIAQPKVPVERFATNVLAYAFPRFDSQNVLCTGTVPSSVPTLTEAESRRGVASDWMRYDSAKSRIRREETAIHESRKESLDDFCQKLKISLRDVEAVAAFLLRHKETDEKIDEKKFMEYCASHGISNQEDVMTILTYLEEAHFSEQSLTRRKARTESLSGFVMPELIEVRERCMSLMSGLHGIDSGATAVVCAYCGTAADTHSCYVRVDAMDPDGLCRNRYTAAPVRGSSHLMDNSNTASRVQLFFCETHFGKLQPLLAHYTMPTTAMIFVFILYATRDALMGPPKENRRQLEKRLSMENQYDDYFTKRTTKRAPRKTGANRVTLVREKRKRTKRSRVATIPNLRITKNTRKGRRGRQSNSSTTLPGILNNVISNIRARKEGVDLKKVIEEVKGGGDK